MSSLPSHCVVVGAGRMGSALTTALRDAGLDQVTGPLARGERCPHDADCVLLCVPDAEIGHAARDVPGGPLVGHVSGATTLAPLSPHESFSMHPLMTVPARERVGPASGGHGAALRPVPPAFGTLEGASAAVAGSTDRALETAKAFARALGMRPFEIDDADRAAYHAAASIASNYLVALEDAAERLLATTGASRDMLVPLVRATVENWARDGAAALTGPIARGDEETVARQRAAIEERAPELLELFDALTESTRELVG